MKIKILILTLFASNMFYGQTWNQSASNLGGAGTFLGLQDNFPLRINTNNVTRMRVNNNLVASGTAVTTQYSVNGFTAANGLNTSGFIGIGTNNAATLNILTSLTKGPFSLLHLNGGGTFLQEWGHRLWMQTGITFTSNNDRMYIGHRSNGANDITDAVFNWSDNAAGGAGPDNMVFTFTTGDGSAGVNDLTGNSPNGREIMRLTGTGNVGIGPLFTNTNIPQSTLHLHTENNVASWLQVSNQNIGLTVNDGLRIGTNNSLNSYMFNQENGSLIFNTNFNTSNLGRERMRISHIGATGVPVASAANFTRIGISLDPTDPITQPRSLLHIGYNTGIPGFATQDGHRNWMDVGTLAVRGSDNIYVGLKQEGTNDRQDAVIAWGDNQTSFNNNGPDYLRFIFARSAVSPSGDAVSATTDGLEVGRFTPTGELGIGNYYNGGLGLPTERIDADGNARLRTLPLQPNRRDTLDKVVLVDTNGVLRWKYISNVNAASNGCSIDAAAPNEVRLGENVNFLTGQANLQSTRYTDMVNFNIMYKGQGINGLRTAYGIGTTVDTLILRGKLHVHERFDINAGDPNAFFPTAGYFRNSGVNINVVESNIIGVRGLSNGVNQNTGLRGSNYGGYFQAANHRFRNVGVAGITFNNPSDGNVQVENIGGEFWAKSQEGKAFGATVFAQESPTNIGIFANANGAGPNSANNIAIGGEFMATNATVNYGIRATAATTAGNFAGYFNGNVLGTGPIFQGSDANLKTNINSIENGLETIMQLKPVSYEFNHEVDTDLNLAIGRNYGLIAQDVEGILPELVGTFKSLPNLNDSTLTSEQTMELIQQKQEFKAINYIGLVPFLIKSVQELKQQVDGLQGQLNNCCKNTSTSTMRLGNSNSTQLDSVKLTDYQSIILNQNVPNPFADETTITYKIDQDFTTAKVLFFTSDGKILKEVTIEQKGEGQIHVFADDLSSGVYSYSLVVDNKLFDTKRMVKTNR